MNKIMSKGLTGDLYEIKVLPSTVRELVEAIQNQPDLSKEDALEMADYLDNKYKISPYVPVEEQDE